MTITIPTISALPTAPSRTDPATFATRGDAFVAALATLRSEMNTTTAAIKTQVEAEVASVSAALGRTGYFETLISVPISGSPSTIDFVHGVGGAVLSTAYDVYEIELINVVLSANSSTMHARTSTNAGSTWDSGAFDYGFAIQNIGSSSTTVVQSTGTTGIQLMPGTAGANAPVDGRIVVYAPGSATPCYMLWDITGAFGTGTPTRTSGAGVRVAAADVDGIRLYLSAGTFVSGTINLLGRRK